MYFLCFRVLCHKLSSDTSESADRAAESGCRACQQLWAQFQPGWTWLSHKIEEWQLLWKSRGFGAHVRTDATCGLPYHLEDMAELMLSSTTKKKIDNFPSCAISCLSVRVQHIWVAVRSRGSNLKDNYFQNRWKKCFLWYWCILIFDERERKEKGVDSTVECWFDVEKAFHAGSRLRGSEFTIIHREFYWLVNLTVLDSQHAASNETSCPFLQSPLSHPFPFFKPHPCQWSKKVFVWRWRETAKWQHRNKIRADSGWKRRLPGSGWTRRFPCCCNASF